MFEPLRFLHIADAALDVPLGDVQFLPESLRHLAEDATLSAFEHMIDAAIAGQVDFLLLTGSTFREADQSLRARLHLVAGLKALGEHAISVFVLPGADDPHSAWRDIPDLPANVTVMAEADRSETPIAVLRDGKVIATIATRSLARRHPVPPVESSPTNATVTDPNRSAPFRIGLLESWPLENLPVTLDGQQLSLCLSALECDYLAVPLCGHRARSDGWRFEPGETLETRDGIAHHPGPLQALSERETGPHGATLIEVDKAGEIRGTFLPFAAVRRLRFEVPVAADASVEDVAEAMLSLVNAQKPSDHEQAWFIVWTLQGAGENFASFKTRPTQTELLDLLPIERAGESTVSLHHQIKLQETMAQGADEVERSEHERLYRQTLELASPNDPRLFQALADRVLSGLSDLGSDDWKETFAPLVLELDAGDVLAKAHALGQEWFAEEQND